MSALFPALEPLPLDPVVAAHPVALRAYLRLLWQLDFSEPRPVKAWGLAEELCVRPQTASRAMDVLVRRGYLKDHGRGPKRVRLFTLVWSKERSLALERTKQIA